MQIDSAGALVSGGASGLGEATVRRLHGGGAHVVIADLNRDKGEALAAELGDRASFHEVNVTDADAVEAAHTVTVSQLLNEFFAHEAGLADWQLGLGHAVLCARPVVGDEPFTVLLADDLIDGTPPATTHLAQAYLANGCSVLGVEEVPRERTADYGIVSVQDAAAALSQVRGIVEKPAPSEAPSTLAVVGRYVLTARIFELLADAEPGRGGEIQLTDAISRLLAHERVLATRLPGKRYDCGSKLGYLQASVELGVRHPEIGEAFAAYLRTRRS